jgi:membrane-associated protease RseP (regulator of RpoE activity)
MSRALVPIVALAAACAHRAPATAGPVRGATAPTALARLRTTLAAGWVTDAVLVERGAASVAGLTGAVASLEDTATGHHRSWLHLGDLSLGDGFDGGAPWEASPDGEIAITDAPAAIARAVTGAWISRRGFLRDAGATWTAPITARAEHRSYQIVTATPDGGAPIALWIDDATGALARTVEHVDTRTIVTTYGDWRPVASHAGQVLVPFAVVVDDGDPHNRLTLALTDATVRAPQDDDSFGPPRTDDRVSFAGGATRTELPFELINNHIYVRALVDGQPVRMIVDTGGLNLLTTASARRLGLTSAGALGGGGVGAARVEFAMAHAGALTVGDATLAAPVFFVGDLGALAEVEGVDLDGIVGFEMFARLAVRIDYPAGRLTLARPGALTPAAGSGAIAVAFRLAERTPIVAGAIDGLPATFTIDTGSRSSLTVTAPFVQAHALVARYHPAFETVTGWGVGGGVRSSPVRFATVAIGDATIRGVAGELFTGDKGAFAGTEASANLGSGALRRFAVTFDYVDRRMYLVPGPTAGDPDRYDRSGLFLIRDGAALRVVSVAPGSAAAKAGLVVDDRVVAIDGAPVASRALPAWRALFIDRRVGTAFALTIERAGARRASSLVLAELLP